MGNILVVGATSFIGQHLVKELLKQKDQVSIFIRTLYKFPTEWEKIVKVHVGDITKKETIKGIFEGIDFVFHLAAKVHDFSKVAGMDKEHFDVNLEGTLNLLEECKNSKIKHFVYFSSVKAMGEGRAEPFNELSSPKPETPYGESKLMAEALVLDSGKKYGFKTTSLRLPLVYGPGNKGNIYKMISATDKGYFFMMGKGESKRSMVYVGNVVDAALSIAGKENADHKVYVITDGIDYSIKQLYTTIAQSLGKNPASFYLPLTLAKPMAKLGDLAGHLIGKKLPFNSEALFRLTQSFTVSSNLIQSEIGFKPKYNLYNTINKTIEWYRVNR